MNISFHGHSIVMIENNGKKAIVDPFINGNELTDLKAEDVEVDYIILTHGHNDHVGDTVDIAKKNNATVVAPVELAGLMESQGASAVGMNIGGTFDFEIGTVKMVHAFHSSSFTHDDGTIQYTGMPTGLIFKIDGKTIYHAGDTGLFGDMKLISEINGPIDLMFVPVGDHFTMGIDDAAYAVNELVKPSAVVPVHYNTFPPIEVDTDDFKGKVDVECQVLKPGESFKF